MSYIPNARTGENGYNDKDLKGDRKVYLAGYDSAIEDILNFENNLDVYSGDSLVVHYFDENPDKAKEFFECLREWAEVERNETAVALLDDQSEDDIEDTEDTNDKEKV